MNGDRSIPRSPLLLSRHDSLLLVVDVQEKLVPVLPAPERLVWNIGRLLRGAALLEVPCLAAEQYPKGLGHLVPPLDGYFEAPPAKITFSCAGAPEFLEQLRAHRRPKVLVAGVETHVCVLQTVCDLITEGYQLFVAVDAVAARHAVDHQTALRRMEASGVTLTTTEGALFEWCERAGSDRFKAISGLAREAPPGPPPPLASGAQP